MRAGGAVQGRGWCRGLLAALALSLLAACQNGSAAQPQPSGPAIGFEVADESTPEPAASESEDPWAVPDVLTEDYVRRVLTEIEAERAAFMRWLVNSAPGESPPPHVAARIHGAYIAESSQQLIDAMVDRGRETGGKWEYVLDPPGQYVPARVVLHRIEADCPLIEVWWDVSQVEPATAPLSRDHQIITLGQQIEGNPVNVTGWVYTRIFDGGSVSEDEIAEEVEGRSMCGSS